MKTVWSQPPVWQWRWMQSHMPHPRLLPEATVRPPVSSSSQIQWACYKKWKVEWEAQTVMCQCSTSTFKTSCGRTVLDTLEWRKWLSRQTVWQSNHHKWLASQKILSAKELEKLPVGTKPRTWHNRLPGERCGKRKHSMISLLRARKGHYQSDKWWNSFNSNNGETSEQQGHVHIYGVFWVRRYHLQLNKLCQHCISIALVSTSSYW